MTEETESDPEEARLRRATERYAKLIGGDWCEFGKGLKLITHLKRPERALDWFRRFIRSRADTEAAQGGWTPEQAAQYADAQIQLNQTKGFHFLLLAILRRDFKEWKRLEKSRSAKRSAEQSVEKRRQRGRVKSKNDKRLGARYKGKRIPRSKKI